MKKFIALVVLLLVLLLVVLFAAKNIIIKTAAEQGVRAITGLALEIQDLKAGLWTTSIHIQGLKLFNPADFPDKLMVDIPEIYVDYDLHSILKKEIHLKQARIYLKEFVVVKTEDGRLNLDALRALQIKKTDGELEDAKAAAKIPKQQAPPLRIDLLELKVDKVVYEEYRRSGAPRVKEFHVNLDGKYKNITDAKSLVTLIVFKALGKTAISSLINPDLHIIPSAIGGTIKSAGEVTKGAANAAEDTIKTTADGIKKIISLPFGQE